LLGAADRDLYAMKRRPREVPQMRTGQRQRRVVN